MKRIRSNDRGWNGGCRPVGVGAVSIVQPVRGRRNTCGVAGYITESIVIRVDLETHIRAAIYRRCGGRAAEPLLDRMARGRIVDPDHDAGRRIARNAVHSEIAVVIIDVSDCAVYGLD